MVDRILLVLKIKNLTPSKFADEIGIQRSSMSHIMSGRNLPSLDLIMKILTKHPDINSEWLIQGIGPMMKTIQIDLFDSQNEVKTNLLENMIPTQPMMEVVNDNKTESIPEKAVEKESINMQPVIEHTETKDVKTEIPKEIKKEDLKEIEKIVILYKNKSFKEYYPE